MPRKAAHVRWWRNSSVSITTLNGGFHPQRSCRRPPRCPQAASRPEFEDPAPARLCLRAPRPPITAPETHA